ncbi:MAG: HAMP domain-containing sensor histidine kinase [Gemmatimonadota bacterium]|nr:HAMP domain-containing sensor histidine kinase [Gemmatimonadota bacterium]
MILACARANFNLRKALDFHARNLQVGDMAKENPHSDAIRHRSILMLPSRISYWVLFSITVIFFLLLLGYFLYTRILVSELERDEDALSRAYAQFWVNAVSPLSGLEDPDRLDLFIQSGKDTEVLRELIAEFNNPMAITDSLGEPIFCRSIGVPETRPEGGYSPKVIKKVMREIERMDRQNRPLRIYNASLDEAFVIHYGDPSPLVKLRTIPLYLGTILGVFLLLSIWFLLRQARTERSLIWAGMARESAHQLGTPLSSLHGWLELLKMNLAKSGKRFRPEPEAREEFEEEDEILEGIGQDIGRLSKVANRFELIGRISTYQELQIEEVLRDTESYFRVRLPKLGKKIELEVNIEALPPVRGNATLLEWAFENLIKNSIDALTGRAGKITIHAYHDRERQEVDITFSDNGPGISRDIRRHIFETGVTTKSKGWGVGLALTRRIIVENHGGRILLSHSSPEEGTVFLVTVPTAVS